MINTHDRPAGWLSRLACALFANQPASTDDWRCDPLGHPALRAMTPDQLADLPPIHECRFAAPE